MVQKYFVHVQLAVGLRGVEGGLGKSFSIGASSNYLESKDKNDFENILKTRRFSQQKSIGIFILDEDILTVISKKLINKKVGNSKS